MDESGISLRTVCWYGSGYGGGGGVVLSHLSPGEARSVSELEDVLKVVADGVYWERLRVWQVENLGST